MDKKISELKKKIGELEKEIERTKENSSLKKERTRIKRFTPLKVLYEWQSPSRMFVQRDKAWYLKIAIVALLFILFFAFLQDFIVILVICIIVLITFLLASIPPHKTKHQITNKGINSMEKNYKWKELRDFWVAEKEKERIVYVRTKLKFPSRLDILIGRKDEQKVVKLLADNLDYKEFEVKQGWLSRISEGVMVNPQEYHKLFIKKKAKKSK